MATSDISGSSLEGLDEEQRRAVNHESGPARVIAGAGSGKTGVLTHRIARLLDAGVDPGSILAITFTNKATGEMRARVRDLAGQLVQGMWITTFHRACVRILQENANRIKYPRKFTIYDQIDAECLVGYVRSDRNIASSEFSAKNTLEAISGFKINLRTSKCVEESAASKEEKQLARIYIEYQQRLRKAEAMDFNDLVMRTVCLLRSHKDLLMLYQDKFTHILVDEYQDLNPAQIEVVKLLSEKHRNLFIVGDDDQSIYGFLGAGPRNVDEFPETFSNAVTYELDINYRSTRSIVSAANLLIKCNTSRKTKTLRAFITDDGAPIVYYQGADDHAEAQFIATEIQDLCSTTPTTTDTVDIGERVTFAGIAILYRTKHHSPPLEKALAEKRIPYKVFKGKRFYDNPEIRVALSFLRSAVRPADEVAIRRAFGAFARDIDPDDLALIGSTARTEHMTFNKSLRSTSIPEISDETRSSIKEFVQFHDHLINLVPKGPSAVLEHALEVSGYPEFLEAGECHDPDGLLVNRCRLLNEASRCDDCDRFLERVALLNDADNLPDDKAVSLMTLHTAKGLDYQVVFFSGLEEDICPHYSSKYSPEKMQEDRRLAYVGITRAKQRLYMTAARQRVQEEGITRPHKFSRFIAEALNDLPESMRVKRSDLPSTSTAGSPSAPATPAPPSDLP